LQRAAHRKMKYGITKADWDAMFERQGRVCGICTSSVSKPSWATDHCHETGKVRGILCYRCNTMLGYIENEDLMLLASYYLRRHRL